MSGTIIVSANAAWNLVNFREGLIRRLVASGWRVVAVAPSDGPMEAHLQAIGCTCECIAIDRKGVSPLRDLSTIWRYWRLFRRYRPSHYLGWTIKPNTYGAFAARLCGVTALCNISGLGTAFIRRSVLTIIARTLYRVCLSKAQTVFFQNDADRSLFLEHGMVRNEQAHLLPGSGVDTDWFQPVADAPNGRTEVTFLLIARLIRDKGIGEYVTAAKQLLEIGFKARFQLLGPRDDGNRTGISAAELDDWMASGFVEYLGDADDVRPIIANADCIVLPSYREGAARVLLEAAAMGKPAVASDVPGCRELVEHGVTGLLCACRDAEALASAMLAMAECTPRERFEMGQAARRRIVERFDERIVIERYLQRIGLK